MGFIDRVEIWKLLFNKRSSGNVFGIKDNVSNDYIHNLFVDKDFLRLIVQLKETWDSVCKRRFPWFEEHLSILSICQLLIRWSIFRMFSFSYFLYRSMRIDSKYLQRSVWLRFLFETSTPFSRPNTSQSRHRTDYQGYSSLWRTKTSVQSSSLYGTYETSQLLCVWAASQCNCRIWSIDVWCNWWTSSRHFECAATPRSQVKRCICLEPEYHCLALLLCTYYTWYAP